MLLFCASSAFAQISGGADYSQFGIGDIQDNLGSASDGMGGTSLAVRSSHAINLLNPAGWSFVKTTRLQIGFDFRQAKITDQTDQVMSQNSGKLQGASALFAIDTASGIAASFGFHPYSSVSYAMNLTNSVNWEGSTVTRTSEYTGTGGLSTVYLGFAFRPLNNLSVGLSCLYYLGSIHDNILYSFDENTFSQSTTFNVDNLEASGIQAGIMYTGIDNLTIGASATANSSLSVSHESHYSSSFYTGDTVLAKSSINSPMPFIWGVGASYQSGKFLFATDYSVKNFSKFSYRSGDIGAFRNASHVSFGISRLANTNFDAAGFDRWAYNFGAGYNQQYYVINGTGIDEYYASVGTEAPISNNAYLDLALTAGSRGTTTNNLLKESFFRLSFTIGIGENWFKPFKRE